MPQDFNGLVAIFLDIIDLLINFLSGLSLLVFTWGLMVFIFKSGDEKGVEEGKGLMKWGLIGLFVMVSIWGILGILSNTFGFGDVGFPFLPE